MVLGENVVISNLNEEDERSDNDSNATDDFDDSLTIANKDGGPSFGNIAVANSTDVHFGNKTYYQGPVTIKQFLYANGGRDDKDSDEVPNLLALKNGGLTCDSVPVFDKGISNPNFVQNGSGTVLTPNLDKTVDSDANKDNNNKGTQWFSALSNRDFIIFCSFFMLLLFVAVTTATILIIRNTPDDSNSKIDRPQDNDEQEIGTPIDYPSDPNSSVTLPVKLKIISRLEWVAQPPVKEETKLVLPVPNVIIHHTATENCTSTAQCVFHVRFIQTFHIESRHWSDIGYNFLVGGDGFAYEGRGWKIQGAHLYGYNSNSIGISFIGTFNSLKPPNRQIVACKKLIAKGVEAGYLTKNFTIVTARQLQATESPGLVLYNEVKTWPHWSPVPSP